MRLKTLLERLRRRRGGRGRWPLGTWGWRVDGVVRRESGGGGGGEGGGRGGRRGGDTICLVLGLFVVVVWRRRRRRRRKRKRRRGRNMSSVGFICGYIKNFSRRNSLFSSAKLFG
ncbi:hypothetical protein ACLB2K_031963 [Fragaria x ananassa]